MIHSDDSFTVMMEDMKMEALIKVVNEVVKNRFQMNPLTQHLLGTCQMELSKVMLRSCSNH